MKVDIIKAWKDEEYRSTLTADQLAIVNNPVASLELSDEQMDQVNGGTGGGSITFGFRPPAQGAGSTLSFTDCCAAF